MREILERFSVIVPLLLFLILKCSSQRFGCRHRMTADHTYSELIRDVPYGAHPLKLDGVDDILFIAWSENAALDCRIRLMRNRLISLSNLIGEPTGLEDDQILLKEAMGPVYLRLKRP